MGALNFKEKAERIDYVDLADLFPPHRRVVVVAPHPDDEVLGCGGILAGLTAMNRSLLLVAVSDGEACYGDDAESRSAIAPSRAAIAALRHAETITALRRLGIRTMEMRRLRLNDGNIDNALLKTQLLSLLMPDDIVITTWRGDHHCDHIEVGHACSAVTQQLGAALIEMPIWMWHCVDPQLTPWYAAKRIRLAPQWLQRKRRAVAAYRSQLRPPIEYKSEPILTAAMLPAWFQSWEMVFV